MSDELGKPKVNLSPEEENSLNAASALYEKGEYLKALSKFESLVKTTPQLNDELKYAIRYCTKVINTRQNGEDYLYVISSDIKRYLYLLLIPGIYLILPILGLLYEQPVVLNTSSIFRIILGGLVLLSAYQINSYLPSDSGHRKLRCKYCGHYTNYIAPDDDVAYLGNNNCSNCGRGYPMPSCYWDTESGQKYMYERRSVTDPEFYVEFEKEHPFYPKSDIARKYEKTKDRVESS